VLAFELVGGWTSARLLVRFLGLGDAEWEPLRAGFTRRGTRERVTLAMGPASPALALRFAAGVDRFRPTLDEALIDEVLAHRAVVVVSDPRPAAPPLDAAATLVRAASAVVNAGALALRCRTSGLAHGADGFQALAGGVDRADDRVAALLALYVTFAVGPRPSTVGLQAFALPDLELPVAGDPDRDLPRLRAAALDLLRGRTGTGSVRPDDRALPDVPANPHGLRVAGT
jgi:hypothetical protein